MHRFTGVIYTIAFVCMATLWIPQRAYANDFNSPESSVHLRKFPYPYKAMLAISSDCDHETLRKFNLIHAFINTKLGLDVSDSFFMYNGCDLPAPIDIHHLPITHLFTYFNGTTANPYGAALIDRYIHCGWIDTMHTYGDFSMTSEKMTRFRRALAKRGVRALNHADDHVIVWVDHGNKSNVDNFGSYGVRPFYDYQQGANPSSPYYHTDVTIPYGIRFVWADQSSSTYGHETMLYPIRLPDGRKVWGFWRRTNRGTSSNKGIDWDWSVGDLSKQLALSNLENLVKHQQYAVIAQHLAANNTRNPLPSDAQEALIRLAHEQQDGRILVARTSRLLVYNVAQQYLKYRVRSLGRRQIIQIYSIDDPVFGGHLPSLTELRGVTFYTPQPENAVLEIGNQVVPSQYIVHNPSDGRLPSIGIKWYPKDESNYAIWDASVD